MYFEQIRKPSKNMSFKRRIAITLGVILLGLLLGVLQKWLDGAGSSILPAILQQLDVGNYFGRLAIWILLGVIRLLGCCMVCMLSLRQYCLLPLQRISKPIPI